MLGTKKGHTYLNEPEAKYQNKRFFLPPGITWFLIDKIINTSAVYVKHKHIYKETITKS